MRGKRIIAPSLASSFSCDRTRELSSARDFWIPSIEVHRGREMATGKCRLSLSTQHSWRNRSFYKLSPPPQALIRSCFSLLNSPDKLIHLPLHGVSAIHPLDWLFQGPAIGRSDRKPVGIENSMAQNHLFSRIPSEGKDNLCPLSQIYPEYRAYLCCCGSQ